MPRSIRNVIISLLVAASLMLSFSGCDLIQPAPGSPDSSSNVPASGQPASPSANPTASGAGGVDVVEEAWQILHENFVEPDNIDSANMTAAAIKAMVEALNDPYTAYLSPHAYELSREDLSGTFQGIGAFVGIREEQLVIISPIPDSPAEKAGILAGDAVLEVDGTPTDGMAVEEAVSRIRGPQGTSVNLLIRHQGDTEPEIISVVRAAINVPSVTFEMREDIAYIRIFQFSERTDDELSDILKNEMAGKGAEGIILDLRSNPGGYLDIVIEVASHFIKDGVVVYVVDNKGKKTASSVRPTDIRTDLPIVALSDNFSASGSEVLMGALQDYGRATIAGTTTFGKGSVDTFFSLKDGSGLYVTISRWLTPNGRLIEGKGIDPDIELTLHGDNATLWAMDYLRQQNKK